MSFGSEYPNPYAPTFKPSSSSLFDGFDSQNLFSESELNSLYQNSLEYGQKIWEREDTAYQRMVKDMQNAGLNPWSGVSSGGSQTSSTNLAESALNTLFSGLNYNLGVMNLSDKQNERLVDTYLDVTKLIANVALGGLTALGRM